MKQILYIVRRLENPLKSSIPFYFTTPFMLNIFNRMLKFDIF